MEKKVQNPKFLPVPSLEDDRDLSVLILLLKADNLSDRGENEPYLPLSEDESESRRVTLLTSAKSLTDLGEPCPCPLSLAFVDSVGAI